ncbi:tetratricopeptide repeat protein [Candidatus Peregrinibacteria bacterium]|nr:MAG: tetratricopeptide repeat protein [Candidatus Peregrinibacteria bacterium]
MDEMREERAKETPERFKATYTQGQNKKKPNQQEFLAYMRKAEYALAQKKYDEAKTLFIQALSCNPEDPDCNFKLAVTYFESNDSRRAEQILVRLAEQRIKNPEIHIYLARLHFKKKSYPQAVSCYVRAAEMDDKNDQTLAALGKLYNMLMHPSLAAECFRRAAELKPRSVDYLFALADACIKDDDYENALLAVKKILILEPYNEDAKQKVAQIEEKMREFENALMT